MKYADNSSTANRFGEGEEMSDEITQQGLLPGVKYVFIYLIFKKLHQRNGSLCEKNILSSVCIFQRPQPMGRQVQNGRGKDHCHRFDAKIHSIPVYG